MTAAIKITNLAKKYGNKNALQGINLTIQEGDFFGLLGPNGAGKSTTIGILTGLTIKTSGEARIFGHETTNEYQLARQQVGVVPQEFNFDNFLTVEKAMINVASFFNVPRKKALTKTEELLEFMELTEKKDAKIMELSGGMKRRLLIVRALLHDPKILILDEPTAGVDVELRRKIWHFTKKLNQDGMTILLTTHYLEEAEALCNRIAIIDQGKILLDEEKTALLQRLKTKSITVKFAGEQKIPQEFLEQFQGEKIIGFEALEHTGSERANFYRFHCVKNYTVADFLHKATQLELKIEDIFSEKEKLEDFFVRFLKESEKK